MRTTRAMAERYGDFELLRLIATGGMAEIYLAKHGGFGGFSRTVVVKRMLPQLAVRPDFVQMFLDEARLAANLNHPNIVQVFNLGEVDGSYFIAMEFVDGPHLGSLFAHSLRLRKPLPIDQCAYIVARAADGLHYAHEQHDPATGQPLHIVHRDISPQNLLVSRQGDVKVTDFGVAKASTQQTKTRTGIIKGKVAYMSPEQCLGEIVDRRTDVFALGIVLYELLTRRRLFRDKSDLLIMQKITGEDVAAPSSINRELDPELDAICIRALARSRSARFSTAAELAEALDSWLISRAGGDARMQLQRWFEQHAIELSLGHEIEMSTSSSTEQQRPARTGELTAATPSLSSAETSMRPSQPEVVVAPRRSSEALFPTEKLLPDRSASPEEPTQRASPPSVTSSYSAPRPADGRTGEAHPQVPAAPEATAPTAPLGLPDPVVSGELERLALKPAVPKAAILVGALAALLVVAVAYKSTRDDGGGDDDVAALADSGGLAAVDGVVDGDGDVVLPPGDAGPATSAVDGVAGKLIIESVPTNVSVLLDDERIIGKTPLTIEHAPGRVRLQAQFKPPVDQELELKPGEERTVRLLQLTGLVVKSNPQRAKVRINGELVGETPLDRPGMIEPEKPLRVKLELPGWDFGPERTLTPEVGRPLVIDLGGRRISAPTPPPPAPKISALNMRSAPFVYVRIGKQSLGSTTFLGVKVPAGRQTLVMTNPEAGINESLTVTIPEDRPLSVTLEWEQKGKEWRIKNKVIK